MNDNIITVKNAEGEPDTQAQIIIQNKIGYTPKVSVIIPVYNVEDYLRECLDSVINQTLKEIEIICVDDGSTDGSLEILKEYAARDGRIKVIYNKKNLGAPGAVKNIGIKEAKGEYIGFVDSDDYVDLNYFEELYKAATQYNADIASIVNITKFTNSNNKSNIVIYTQENDILITPEEKTLLMKRSSANWAKIYRRSLIGKYNIKAYDKFSTSEDNLFAMSIMSVANKIVIVPYITYYYRQRQGSVTGRKRTSQHFSIFDVYLLIDQFINRVFSDDKRDAYLSAVNERKKIDFKWFLNDIDPLYIDEYKEKLYAVFPQIYNYIFPLRIPIILSSDDNYAPYMYVTMYSALENAMPDTFYDFYLLVPSAFSKRNTDLIMELKAKYNCGIHFIDMKNAFADLTMHIPHITSPTYYRLLAGDLLPKEYDKCIYLDVDVCVCRDLVSLYNIDMGSNYIAGVVAPGFYFNQENHCKRLGLPSMKQYVNAGVLLMNLKQIRQDNMTTKFIELSKKNYSAQDQDVINVACYGRITTLPPQYNAAPVRIFSTDNRLLDLFSKENILTAQQNPIIVHYADKVKPWKNISMKMASHWWKYAAKTPLFDNTQIYASQMQNWYSKVNKQPLNLNNPQTFNEKIQWLKLYDSTPIKTRLADKYLVRDWVKEKIGEEYLIPLLGVYDDFEEIDFDKLPNQFVIKCNHGSGWNIVVKNKSELDLKDTKEKLNKWMNENFAFKAGCELHYRNIQPKIVIEKYIENNGGDLLDYKFWCFNGKVAYILYCAERNVTGLKMEFYDRDWNRKDFMTSPSNTKKINKPDNLEQMIKLSEVLSKDINFVRVDFYRMDDGTIYFGEMTFTPTSGTVKWINEKIDLRFGQMIALPNLAYNIDTGEYYEWFPQMKYKQNTSSPLLYKDIGLGCNTWCEPRNVSGNAYTYDLSDNIYTSYVSWDPIKEGSCDVEILRLSAVEKRSKRVVEFPVDKIISSGKISGRRVEFRNQKCWIGCAVEGAYESFTVEAKVRSV